jgi:hypothetical protein
MQAYLAEGAINPGSNPTANGFNRVFAAWLISDDLPFTTGESTSCAALFKYIKCTYKLPSDTTVRNHVSRIFVDVKAAVVQEIAVRDLKLYKIVSNGVSSQLNLKSLIQRILGQTMA